MLYLIFIFYIDSYESILISIPNLDTSESISHIYSETITYIYKEIDSRESISKPFNKDKKTQIKFCLSSRGRSI